MLSSLVYRCRLASTDDALVFPAEPVFDALSMEPVHAVDECHVVAPLVELFSADGALFDQVFRRRLHFVGRDLTTRVSRLLWCWSLRLYLWRLVQLLFL